jgi:hypothetical protein
LSSAHDPLFHPFSPDELRRGTPNLMMKLPRYLTAIVLLAGALVAATDMARVIRHRSASATPTARWQP